MNKYKVIVHFEGCVDFDVEAVSEEHAEEIAMEEFEIMSPGDLIWFRKENLDTDVEVEEV